MAYNTKPIITDKDGNPISQYYNPVTDQYEPVEGAGGGNAVVLYNADGTENNELSLQPILDKLSQLTGTIIDEETRKSNEITREDNEVNRIALYDDLLAELSRIEQITEQVPQSVLDAVAALTNELEDLAGEGRTTETVKGNADAIEDLNTELGEHKAEKAQQAHGENLELIASVSLDSVAQINFINIPQTYKHLKLVLIGRVNVAQKDTIEGIRLNDISTQSYNTQRLISAGTQITSAYSSETRAYIGKLPGTNASSDKQNGFFEIDILDYSGTKRKSVLARYTSQLDDGVETGIYSTFTTIERAINKINTTNWWQAGTIATLYGVRGEQNESSNRL